MKIDPKGAETLAEEFGRLVAELWCEDFRHEMQHLRSSVEIDRLFQQAATALEAQAAELAAVRGRHPNPADFRYWEGRYRDEKAENERLSATLAEARKALEPFSAMAGEMFARGWNEDNVVIALNNPNEPHRVTAGDFFVARRALTGGQEE